MLNVAQQKNQWFASQESSGHIPVGLIIKRATMQGFLVLDYLPRSQQALEDIATWVMEGKLQHREDIQEGIENCPQTLNRLFTGENKGKQLLKI